MYWTDDNIDDLFDGDESIRKLNPIYCQKDYYGYVALTKYGGFVLDHDTICHESLDYLSERH
jgi:hypothetical protein